MTTQQVTIRYPDGMTEIHSFPEEYNLLIEPEGEWLHASVFQPGEGKVKNFLGQDVPAPGVRVLSASVFHGDIISARVEDEHAD